MLLQKIKGDPIRQQNLDGHGYGCRFLNLMPKGTVKCQSNMLTLLISLELASRAL